MEIQMGKSLAQGHIINKKAVEIELKTRHSGSRVDIF